MRKLAITLASGLFVIPIITGLTQPLFSQSTEHPKHVVYYNLFKEYFKNKEFESSYEFLPWLLENAPLDYNGERIRRRAAATYIELAKANLDNQAYWTAMLDTAAVVFETAPSILESAGQSINQKRWWIDYANTIIENEKLMASKTSALPDILIKAFDAAPGELDPYYLRIIVRGLGKDRKDEAIDFMDRSENSYGDDEEVATFFAEARNALFKSPQERMTFLESRLEKDPSNIEIIGELFEISRALEESDKMEQMGARLLELEPSARTFRLIAQLKYDNGEYSEAIDLNDKALGMVDDSQLKQDIYYNKSLAQYANNDLCAAWRSAKNALREDYGFAKGLLLQGDILSRMIAGSSFEREDRAVYWLAADYYGRAKTKDSSLSGVASSKANSIQGSMPSTETKFMNNWKVGESYSVNYGRYSCVDEKTTVK